METNFTERQSLETITGMIEQAKNYHRKGSLASYVFWGWMIAGLAVADFLLLTLVPSIRDNAHAVWALTLPAAVVNIFIQRRVDRQALVRTHINAIIGYIWTGFAISVWLFLAIVFTIAITTKTWFLMITLTPVIMLMLGMAQFATARACRLRSFLTGAIAFWAGAALSAACILSKYVELQFIILALCMILGFVVPAGALDRKASGDVQ
ncbi:MAG: hypothetical protein LBH06_02320 [Rikenellaceae bacterium]|jgi:hypothetical protein|nr:hypothetical protein [Rikenellaceae bacterium]